MLLERPEIGHELLCDQVLGKIVGEDENDVRPWVLTAADAERPMQDLGTDSVRPGGHGGGTANCAEDNCGPARRHASQQGPTAYRASRVLAGVIGALRQLYLGSLSRSQAPRRSALQVIARCREVSCPIQASRVAIPARPRLLFPWPKQGDSTLQAVMVGAVEGGVFDQECLVTYPASRSIHRSLVGRAEGNLTHITRGQSRSGPPHDIGERCRGRCDTRYFAAGVRLLQAATAASARAEGELDGWPGT